MNFCNLVQDFIAKLKLFNKNFFFLIFRFTDEKHRQDMLEFLDGISLTATSDTRSTENHPILCSGLVFINEQVTVKYGYSVYKMASSPELVCH